MDVFIIIVLITFVLIAYLTIRDWVFASRFSSHSVQKIIKLSSQQTSLGNWQQALELLSPILESGRGGKDVSLLHVQVLRESGRLTDALHAVVSAMRVYPEELQFRVEEGFIHLDMDHPQEALDAFKVCAPIMRGEGGVLAIASALNRAGHPTDAFELIEPWMQETQNGALFSLAGDTFFERKNFSEAIQLYSRALALGENTHLVTTQLAHAYRRLGNLSEAEKIFRKLLEKDAADLIAALGLGACLQERGHFQKALLIYQSSGAWKHKDPRMLKEAGLCALRTKKFLFAEHYFFEVLQQGEPEALVLAYYALALEHQNKWQEAEQVYLKTIQRFPAYPHGYRALAWMFGVGLTRTLSQEQGISFAHIALKLKHDPVSWEILSACEARVGNFERAYQIQLLLSSAHDQQKESRTRRQQALRNLRKHHPLDERLVTRSLVA